MKMIITICSFPHQLTLHDQSRVYSVVAKKGIEDIWWLHLVRDHLGPWTVINGSVSRCKTGENANKTVCLKGRASCWCPYPQQR